MPGSVGLCIFCMASGHSGHTQHPSSLHKQERPMTKEGVEFTEGLARSSLQSTAGDDGGSGRRSEHRVRPCF